MDKELRVKNKKSQQEIVGFMIIIVIVVIVGVIFLGIYLRGDKQIVKDDAELRNFLTSSLRYTSECYKDNEPNYRTLEDLAIDCYQNNGRTTCLNGTSCSVLNSTYNWLLARLWPSGKDRPIKYSKMTFEYARNSSDYSGNKFMTIKQGNETGCLSVKSAEQALSLEEGNILVNIEICKGS